MRLMNLVKKAYAKNLLKMKSAATIKEFYNDTYLFDSKAKIVMIKTPELSKRDKIIYLNSTIFHAQGGGQPSDIGIIYTTSAEFKVSVAHNEGDQIAHKGILMKGEIKEGEEVCLKISNDNRKLNARIHSAGHLLDIAFHRIGYKNEANKGYHYPRGAYIEYAGNVELKDQKEFIDTMEKEVKDLIQCTKANDKVASSIYRYDQYKSLFKGELLKHLPNGSDIRVIKLMAADKGCPCGGTHVKHLKEINGIKITKAKNEKNIFRISYEVC